MYFCRNMTDVPLQEIGQAMGERDHTTIINGIEKISKDIEKKPTCQNTVNILKKILNEK